MARQRNGNVWAVLGSQYRKYAGIAISTRQLLKNAAHWIEHCRRCRAREHGTSCSSQAPNRHPSFWMICVSRDLRLVWEFPRLETPKELQEALGFP
jgi:hypothetical protein